MRTRHLALLLAVWCCACDRSSEPTAFILSDSAGVAVAISTAPLWATDSTAAWRLDDSPFLDLTRSGEGPQHQFFRVADAVRLSDGRIAVADGGASEIRLYSPEGAFLASAGREGEGPGEYRQISSLVRLPGDSLLVASWPTRITLLKPDLGVVTTFSLEAYAFRVHWLSDTTLVAELVYPSVMAYEGEGGLIRHPLSVARFDRQGSLIDTLLVTAGYEEFMQRREGRASSMRTLFGKQGTVGVGHGILVTGSAESMELTVHDKGGALRRIIRVPGYPVSVTPEEVAREQAAFMGPDPSPRAREIIGSLPVPSNRPAYTELLVDSEGCIWAGTYQGLANLEDPRAWEVFSPEGQWLGTMRTPARFTPFEIGPDHILGRALDEWDAETIQLLRLRR